MMNISSHHFPIRFNQSTNAQQNRVDNPAEQAETKVSAADKSTEVINNKPTNTQAGNKANHQRQQADKESSSFTHSQSENNSKSKIESELDQQQISELRELRQRDREVRAHEQAHAAVAGSLAKGGPSFSYERGPDGQLYAVGGEVQIDTSTVAGDPKATAEKARQVRRAALAPAQPSQQDRAVAAAAAAIEAQARVEIAQQQTEDGVEKLNDQFSEKQNPVENEGSDEMKETINSEVHSKCAECGGQHSSATHEVSVILDNVFNQIKLEGEKENQFNIAI